VAGARPPRADYRLLTGSPRADNYDHLVDSTGTVVAPVSHESVLLAAETIRGRVHRTPTLTASSLGDVVLKAELLQKTGSFKVRGVLNKLAALTAEEKARGVIGISAGNHAQALAWGAAREGLDCLVVMHSGASPAKVAATKGYGARVDLESDAWPEAFQRLDDLIESTGRTLVHPFADPLVIAGQGTVALELLEDAPHVETILVSAGGGGLSSGIAAAVGRRARVVVVEPEGSAVVHESLAAGQPVSVVPESIADGLCTPYTSEVALKTLLAHDVESLLVTEEEIEDAFRWLYGRAKLACEPAAAAALAPLLTGRVEPRRVAVVVSGGNVAPATAAVILGRSATLA
jgi:threonine dehydratase